jgi:hypothetical protein
MYSRRRCGLCDEARDEILSVRNEVDFEYRELFIDGDEGLERDYGVRVPVVLVDGREEFEISVDPVRLRRLLSLRN